eukprot:Nitzschia sp. Nitz4//scaffold112_size70979//61766//65686//NITZ4_005911-RA/size70979-processed-gene-0.45-mRNA-1//1//CDS//3329533292//1505//frame0
MYIQEVIIDGFKSYAHRTVVEGFDPHFNAITGLNGSGKSNILDSICFVLGITNLSQVRAGSLSELVYKQGQAGVNKASVTIVFNNQDESSSPVGYEQCSEVTVTRQVLLGGKSKYLINGKNSPAGQVQNLFHSVQLNVNNPHFLIMQGRITKVLNMKPNEILGMVEEAAGTRMYETKREAAIKTIDKKQAKVDELNSILSEEITPTLERLRGEKESYLKWSKNNADIERIERFVVAADYTKAQNALNANVEGSAEMEAKISELESESEKYQQQVASKDAEVEDLAAKMKGEFEKTHNSLKLAEEKQSKELVKVTSSWQNSKELSAKAEEEVQIAKAAVEETKATLAEKESEVAEEKEGIQHKVNAKAEAEQNYQRLHEDYQKMQAGLSMSQGDEGMTLPDQIAKAHSDSKTAEAKVKQATMKMSHLSKELKSVEKQMKKDQKSAAELNRKQEAAQIKHSGLKEKLESLSFDENEFGALEQERDELTSSVEELTSVIKNLTTTLERRLSFNYTDPVRGFDRSKVKGLVAKLIQVKNADYATAVEVVAGGKLYQVVVDEAIVGKAIIERGNLSRRVTIIPLDKIQSRGVSNSAAQRAREMASAMKAEATPAIELIGFDEEVRAAMEHVFGAAIVVNDAKAANQICDATKTRTVTCQGDVYDPSGTITGGSSNNFGTTLVELSKLSESKKTLATNSERLVVVNKKLHTLNKVSEKYSTLQGQFELAEAELQSIQKHLSQTAYGVLQEKFNAMSKEFAEAEKECEDMKEEQEKKAILYEELREREVELTQERETRMGALDKAVREAKKAIATLEKEARQADSQWQTLSLELEDLRGEVASAQKNLEATEESLKEARNAEDGKAIAVGEVKALYDEARSALDEFEQQLERCSSELASVKHQRAELAKQAEDYSLEAKKLSVSMARIHKERSNAEKFVAGLLKEYPWIESEKSAFGVEGGDYDFNSTDVAEMSSLLKSLKGEQDSLSKKINKKVMGMIEKAEGEYAELLRKRKVVENDKKKIKSVIEELDVKKKTELQRTWKKVNKDFGSIFSTLLPGASSKLEPPEGMEAWEGLEVKVAFGNVWKESLSELSGGQRSLLALSLILSLLLFKPAPMYILDEVDAALDLSHTQNIGNMLKTHFSQSQFIVVSLKEGMFNNANVIFRTKFVDGVSTVSRTIGTGASDRARALAENRTENVVENNPSRKRAARGARQVGKENASSI